MTRRKSDITFAIFCLALGLLAAAAPYLWRLKQTRISTAHATPGSGLCLVVRIVDGATIRVMFGRREEPVRLLRIDTPERGQPGFDEATAALAELLKGGQVRIEFETPGKVHRDRYKRLRAYVFLPDGRCANVEMVRLGWSEFWTKYGKGRLVDDFVAAELEAKSMGRGVWEDRGGGVDFVAPPDRLP